jgi:hypothetical protein
VSRGWRVGTATAHFQQHRHRWRWGQPVRVRARNDVWPHAELDFEYFWLPSLYIHHFLFWQLLVWTTRLNVTRASRGLLNLSAGVLLKKAFASSCLFPLAGFLHLCVSASTTDLKPSYRAITRSGSESCRVELTFSCLSCRPLVRPSVSSRSFVSRCSSCLPLPPSLSSFSSGIRTHYRYTILLRPPSDLPELTYAPRRHPITC